MAKNYKIPKGNIFAKINKKQLMKLGYLDLERLSIWARFQFAITQRVNQKLFNEISAQFNKLGGTTYQNYVDGEY